MLDLILKYLTLNGLIWGIVLVPLATSVINWAISAATSSANSLRANPFASFFGLLGPILSFLCAFLVFWVLTGLEGSEPAAITGPAYRLLAFRDWSVDIGLRTDQLSLVMSLMITGVGSLIHIYSIGYMAGDEGYPRYFAELNLFLFFMLLLVLADNLFLMFVGWEGVGLCSYLLIGFWFTDIEKAKAGKKAFIVNRIGDFGFIIGMFIIFGMLSGQELVGESVFNFGTIERNAAFLIPMATPICLALFFGAVGKSAQIPLYIWLPDAMAGPTPVSALIHAATMVTAGVYMVARLGFLFALSPVAMQTVAVVGAATALFAAVIGLAQKDIKKVLAYSTISQIGFMFLAEGVGAFGAGIYHLITHSFFKACLFLAAGSVIHALNGEQDMFKMGGLKKYLPGTCMAFVTAAVAISGIWPFSGFFSKDEILWEVYGRGHTWLFIFAFVTSGITAFYIFRAVGLTFFGRPRMEASVKERIRESSVSMLVPVVLLALLSAIGGVLKGPVIGFIAPRFISSMLDAPRPHQDLQHIIELVSTLWCAHWAIVAWVVYVQRPSWPVSLAGKFKRTYGLIYEKFYIDEIYQFIFVKPACYFSDKILAGLIDTDIIDNAGVSGSARVVGFFGEIAGRLQTGAAPYYLFCIVLGLAGIIIWMVF